MHIVLPPMPLLPEPFPPPDVSGVISPALRMWLEKLHHILDILSGFKRDEGNPTYGRNNPFLLYAMRWSPPQPIIGCGLDVGRTPPHDSLISGWWVCTITIPGGVYSDTTSLYRDDFIRRFSDRKSTAEQFYENIVARLTHATHCSLPHDFTVSIG